MYNESYNFTYTSRSGKVINIGDEILSKLSGTVVKCELLANYISQRLQHTTFASSLLNLSTGTDVELNAL